MNYLGYLVVLIPFAVAHQASQFPGQNANQPPEIHHQQPPPPQQVQHQQPQQQQVEIIQFVFEMHFK
ncbi:hypothetical protein ANCDUO_25211 [Ancylostoma duodenale]|uniref:Uncharacterized protein n=1 Tax=Ancylostoma duodenale TaxID=51022 RepID=A0A0C2FII2_9BILA|nr:hypothetical protein ANCDUO_25211 [Ancylostoma duodenale]